MTPFDEISEIYFWYFVLIIAIAAMVVYVAPSIIALKRKIRNKEILVVLNLIDVYKRQEHYILHSNMEHHHMLAVLQDLIEW